MNKFEENPLLPGDRFAWHHTVSLDAEGALVLHWWINEKRVDLNFSKEESINLLTYLYVVVQISLSNKKSWLGAANTESSLRNRLPIKKVLLGSRFSVWLMWSSKSSKKEVFL